MNVRPVVGLPAFNEQQRLIRVNRMLGQTRVVVAAAILQCKLVNG